MSDEFTTDNITQLRAVPRGTGWEIRFASGNAACCHQLYVNGRLADWTDTAAQRAFALDVILGGPAEILVAAVAPALRRTDLSARLSDAQRNPAWVYRASVVRSHRHGRGDCAALLGDHATGQIDDCPLDRQELRPAWLDEWGLGAGPFGSGGFGYDAAAAPGLRGAFGAGPFGIGAELLELSAALAEEGAHQLLVRTIAPDGRGADGEPVAFQAAPPPAPPAAVTITDYDAETQTVTIQIS